MIKVQVLEQDQTATTTTLITILITHAIFSHESGHTLAVLWVIQQLRLIT